MNILELNKELEHETDEQVKIQLKSKINELKEAAERKIRKSNRDIHYSIREWSIEIVLSKYSEGLEEDKNELFIPDYQRDYKWDAKIASRFIESILLNFPIPYLYIADVDAPDDPDLDGRAEIIDGSQRIRALHYFYNDDLVLENLKELKELEGFKFSDFVAARKRRFLRETLRMVELKGEVDESSRRDLFERINSGVKRLEAMEVRHGSEEANSLFYKSLIVPCSEDKLFSQLAPLSDKKKKNADHRELVLRFFAYLNNLHNYKGYVKPFLDDYLKKESLEANEDTIEQYKLDFDNTMNFIDRNFGGMGFKKTLNSKTTPRARYEAIAIGVAMALKEEPNLEPAVEISTWLMSDEFQTIVGADSANNTSQLIKRIDYVKNKLLVG
ncbi:DUF262 domain-containing protein [Photobacterium damselae]|uniref:DUF262 domain-containing protein n=3 Tax=Photobacterium damselae TaxID=38293 RepID=A0ACD3SZ37_PHODM|nr:DUF262 domain-containing protein [Photobacterium damselae]RDL28809.1 hypothetical protein BC461_02495 [Photobacterium damselae]TMX45745.1 DUF262 domain-containing protein [Photobacterium damselae]TMX62189.1 DUF262 domain-containing protein [Photobacterium damselae]TMX73272.1 DUF262 domain-containing protein [Photobacterium damselae]TMX73346.1 DUF262 domain-containing protein [Photobacterium damselae]